MVDIVLDIRRNSPTFGKAVCYDMPASKSADFGEWIWVPVGFAHGNYYPEKSYVEYFCTGQYSPGCEASIPPLANDIDWSMSSPELKVELDNVQDEAIQSNREERRLNGLRSEEIEAVIAHLPDFFC